MERRGIFIHGTVQGVGFRPFVFGLASRLNLAGFVSNTSSGVRIEIEGDVPQLDQFLSELEVRPPPLARIDELVWERQPPRGDRDFHIEQSLIDPGAPVVISPDVATCEECLAELFDPRNRRYRYPFLNCTNCGPRLTIITGAPYDRERTTMSPFTMCDACRAEYENPSDRRFHAQPSACPVCGPRLAAADSTGHALAVDDPLHWFVELLRGGGIGAMKGLGGYHLVCDAGRESAVAELRRRKHRDEKPFAVMVANLQAAEELCVLSPAERELLTSPARPIVLLRKRGSSGVADAVAPRNPTLGVMLPYTPLHHLLMRAMNAPLVMTSGNRSDEPICTGEPEVFARLAGIADAYLTHNRPINVRCDDSVTRVIGATESPVRRSRGYAPRPIRLLVECPASILAVGGQLKGAFALGRDRQAILSHHLGDLDHLEAYRAFEKDITLYENLFAIHPQIISHDLHPDYASTHYAQRRARERGLLLIPVQHHHAHMASCMAEHGLNETVIGVSFDGTGYGTDGAIWGGEFLVGDYEHFERAGHLRNVALPGGDRAVKQPWRMALSHLIDAECDPAMLKDRVAATSLQTVTQMIERRFNAPMTSSAGRLFDAVASLAGLHDQVSYEGQAAVELEWLATGVKADGIYPFELTDVDGRIVVDTRPIIASVAGNACARAAPSLIARRFHSTMVEIISAVCRRIRRENRIDKVTLSGGVFLNALLTAEVETRLTEDGFRVFRHRLVPPNDGGISLGQLAIAARLCQLSANATSKGSAVCV